MKTFIYILKGFLVMFTAMIAVWLFGAYINWDLSWITEVGNWSQGDRIGLGLVTLIFAILVVPAVFYEEIDNA